jgi:hypothetical protein
VIERRSRPPATGPFRILSLAGGGYLGLYSAAVLEQLEQQAGEPLARFEPGPAPPRPVAPDRRREEVVEVERDVVREVLEARLSRRPPRGPKGGP